MSIARRLHHSYSDYLAVEKTSQTKHEYLDGEIYAMAGGTPEHGRLAANIISLLSNRVPKSCHVFSSDVKINVLATGLSAYPDGSVICGNWERDPIDDNALTNPTLLFEVTSRSTEDYDRGPKRSHYQQMPSLKNLLIVAHQRKQVTVVARSDGEWRTRDYLAGEKIRLEAPDVELTVDEIYSVLPTPM